MSTPLQQTRLAELLDELGLSQAEFVRRSRTSVTIIARALRGEQLSAISRARILAALNQRRTERELPELLAADLFPQG